MARVAAPETGAVHGDGPKVLGSATAQVQESALGQVPVQERELLATR